MIFKTLVLAAILAVLTYQVAAKGNACSTEDTSHLSLPEVMGTYLGNPTLLNAYLTRFRSHPYVDTFFKYLREDVLSSNQQASLLAMESALLTSTFLGNKVNDTCALAIATELAVEYENTGDRDTINCAIDHIEYAAKVAAYDTLEFFIQEVGCGSYYDKPELSPPTCSSNKCVSGGHPTNWDATYKLITSYSKTIGIAVNPAVYSNLKQLLGTQDKNLWGVALTWLSVELHCIWAFKAGVTADPVAFQLATGVLQYMEMIAYSKDCSCEDRVKIGLATANNVVNPIYKEAALLKSKFK